MRFLVFILALVIAMPAMADDAIFRNFVWGVSKADVRHFEKAKFYKEEGDSLFFLEKPNVFRRLIRYDFKDGKLWGAKYEYQDYHVTTPSLVMDEFVDIQKQLEKEYGKPEEEKFIWKNTTYRDHPDLWSRAMVSGDLRMQTNWKVNDTMISLNAYHDGSFYQLFYTLELVGKDGQPDAREILNLPAVQKNKGVSRP